MIEQGRYIANGQHRSFFSIVAGAIALLALALVPSSASAADWEAAADISGASGSKNDRNPAVAIAPDGSAVALWSQTTEPEDTDISVVMWSARTAAGPWSAPQRITPTDGSCANWDNSQTDIRVAMDKDGNATAAWVCDGTPQNVVQVATRPAGGSFGTPTDLTSASGDVTTYLSRGIGLAVGPDGEAVVVYKVSYQSESPARWEVHAQRRPAGSSSFGPASVVFSGLDEPGGTSAIQNPRVAAGPEGTFAIEFEAEESDTLDERIFAAVSPAGTSAFGTAEPLTSTSGGTDDADTDGYQSIAVDDTGRAVATWVLGPNGPDTAQAAVRSAGASGTWGSVQDLTAGTDDASSGPVAAGPEGTVVYAFDEEIGEGDDAAVEATLQPGASTFSAATYLSDGTTDIDEPTVGVGAGGLTTVAWSDDDDPGNENDNIEERTRQVGAASFDPIIDLSDATEGDSEDAVVAISACTGATALPWEISNSASPPYWIEATYRAGSGTGAGTSEWCPAPPSPDKPFLKAVGKAGRKSLKVRVGCGGDEACRVKLTGVRKLKAKTGRPDGKAKGKTVSLDALVTETVALAAGQRKTVKLAYTKYLRKTITRSFKAFKRRQNPINPKIRVTAKQVGGKRRAIVVFVGK